MNKYNLPYNVSKEPIKDFFTIIKMAKESKAIYVRKWKKHTSASFILGMQFRLVYIWLEDDQFFKFIKDE